MKPQPPITPSPTFRDDLPAVVRDASLPYAAGEAWAEDLMAAMRRLTEALEQDGIPHVLVGGLAVLQFIEGRNTRDIDIIIAASDIPRLPDFRLEERNEWFATGLCGPLRVDLLFTANPLFLEVLERRSEPRDFNGARLNCATPAGILLLKLFALPSLYRQGNIERAALYETDILQLLHRHPQPPEELLAALAPHLPASDINALRQVLAEILARSGHAALF